MQRIPIGIMMELVLNSSEFRLGHLPDMPSLLFAGIDNMISLNKVSNYGRDII